MQDQPIHDKPLHDRPPRRRIPGKLVAALSTVVVLAGSATAWWTWQTNTASNPGAIPSDVQGSIQPSPSPSGVATEQRIQIYWIKDTGTALELVPSAISVQTSEAAPADVLKAAFETLLKGPDGSSAEMASTIPDSTKVLNLTVQTDGIHIDLSPEFTAGGGSASMSGRLAQVIYTATSLDPSADVWISVDGKPLEVLGGEGLIVNQPTNRQDFEANFQL